jgi:hypothetical protein
LCEAWWKRPWYCLAGCCFPCCAACYQREMLLKGRTEDYRCCQGAYGKCWCPGLVKRLPHLCICLETWCCTTCSVKGNRALETQQFPIKNTLLESIMLVIFTLLSFLGFVSSFYLFICLGCLTAQQEHQRHQEDNLNESSNSGTTLRNSGGASSSSE